MARIPDDELDALKRSTDLAALVRSKGIVLQAHGSKDLCGLSPFTDEKTPSFIVTPSKNLWHCMSSGQGGSVIDFVMLYDGVSFREAVELLQNKSPSLYKSAAPVKVSTVPKLPSPIDLTTASANPTDAQGLFKQVLEYYAQRLAKNPAAIDYLKKRGLYCEEALQRFQIGYADRTLGLTLPHKNRKDGAHIRQCLQALGLYRPTGREHFNGCLVFPIIDAQGTVTEIYGRKANEKQKNKLYHLYLPGPHHGIWNPNCLKSPEVILTESIIDALTFWVNGFRNVTCIYGTEGFNDEHLQAFKAHKTKRIYLAYDRDKAGDRAAERDAQRLQAIGIECYRVRFPVGMDANEYALKVTPANKSLGLLLKAAQWLGKGHENQQCGDDQPQLCSEGAQDLGSGIKDLAMSAKIKDPSSQDAACASSSLVALAANKAATGAAKNEANLTSVGEDYFISMGPRDYRIRGLQKNASLEVLKVNLRLICAERFYLDTLDFYRAKDREAFIRAAAAETLLEPDLIKRDLGQLLLALDQAQEQRIQDALQPQKVTIEMAAKEEKAALQLLQNPDLLQRILTDFDACGIVGEATNKLTGYLACVSRQLDRPLAVIIQSTSAAGKSTLMESILAFIPEEARIKYSAMTGQSLYYLGETDLKHKILAIVEEEGAEKASYALKLLQSEGELTIASTGKDEQGRMKTEEYHVEGPVMIFLTTTAVDIDEELLNRCLVLTVDESREQTKAIHDLQREAETFAGLKRKVEREQILQVHRNAQRLLQPLHVVNPYAQQLTFLSDRTRTRRDHVKYLTLIRSIALLHQKQRPLKEKDGLHYIEVTLQDIAAANTLAHEVLGRSLDELPPQTRRLLEQLKAMVEARCQSEQIEPELCWFTRREVREFTGWSNTQLKVHLDRLEELEYIYPRRAGMRGSAYEYELLFDGDIQTAKPQLIGLIDLAQLNYDEKFTGQPAEFTGPKRPQNGAFTTSSLAAKPLKNRLDSQLAPNPQNAQAAPNLQVVVS
jgi:DNA primase catalytic core